MALADMSLSYADVEARSLRVRLALGGTGLLMLFHALVTFVLVFTWPTQTWAWDAYDIFGSLYPVAVIFTAVLWIMWHNGAQSNLLYLGRAPRYASAATIYWWFVPLANLVMPYLVTADTVAHTDALEGPTEVEPAPVLLWWSLFVGGTLLAMATANWGLELFGSFTGPLLLEVLAAAAIVAATYLGTQIVDRVTKTQEALVRVRL